MQQFTVLHFSSYTTRFSIVALSHSSATEATRHLFPRDKGSDKRTTAAVIQLKPPTACQYYLSALTATLETQSAKIDLSALSYYRSPSRASVLALRLALALPKTREMDPNPPPFFLVFFRASCSGRGLGVSLSISSDRELRLYVDCVANTVARRVAPSTVCCESSEAVLSG